MLGGLVHRLIGGGRLDFVRKPDVVIGGMAEPYMLRWWIIPRNRLFNVYLHCFLRSDDDRALHDHPWINLSLLLDGRYTEHSIRAGGIQVRKDRKAGGMKFRWPGAAHRVELTHGPCWTLFITGPVVRNWGFHCPESGWIPHEQFIVEDEHGSSIYAGGCGETIRPLKIEITADTSLFLQYVDYVRERITKTMTAVEPGGCAPAVYVETKSCAACGVVFTNPPNGHAFGCPEAGQ